MIFKKTKILLVDDHTIVRNGIRMMLETVSDIQVTGEAASAAETMLLVQQQSFDVVLLDIELPDSSGLDLLKILHQNHPKIAVLMLSTYAEDIYKEKALSYGAAGYLTKGTSLETLVSAIHTVAEGSMYVTPERIEKSSISIDDKSKSLHNILSDREYEVFKNLALGLPLTKIGELLDLNAGTIATYRGRILEKLNLTSNAELVRYAIKNNLIP